MVIYIHGFGGSGECEPQRRYKSIPKTNIFIKNRYT